MRKLLLVLIAVVVGLPAIAMYTPAAASPADQYSGPYFGDGNLPPGCENDALVGELELRSLSSFQDPKSLDNVCHHMRADMNGLDSPQVDVLVMVPASPTAERDMRILRQSIEMWEGGIDYLADEMGLDWLADGMDFHITVEAFDPAGEDGGEFTTYPIVDPEIVVVAANPIGIGYAGIGIDPIDAVFVNEDFVPCHNISNPFDLEYWESLPGFNSHHEDRGGTYVEDCEGGGGNICFAVNAGNDPALLETSSLFDLVSHEVGHCLTIGHVGDGAEGRWGATPKTDIMAYSNDPPGLSKCVSTLNVEGIALQMSKYLDVNSDGAVTEADQVFANDQVGQGRNVFQVQHPDDHLYASGTGSPLDCPQPDTGELPGERVDWTPTPVKTHNDVLTVTSPQDGAISDDGIFHVMGTVERVPLDNGPTEPTASIDDAANDATSPITEITSLGVAVTDTTVDATISLVDLWPSTDAVSPTSYSLSINGREFDSFIRYAFDRNPMTWDNGGNGQAAGYLPPGSSTWDLDANTVTFHIPRTHLAAGGIQSPYYASSTANFGVLSTAVVDDRAPDGVQTIGVASASTASLSAPQLLTGTAQSTVTFEQEGGNTFYTEDSTLGVERGTSDLFTLDVPELSDVQFTLSWTDAVGGTDLDLYVTGAAEPDEQGTSATPGETVALQEVRGILNIRVAPYFVADPIAGSTYTLTATVTTTEGLDGDGDGIADSIDACPTESGVAPTGCPDRDGDGVADVDDVCPDVAGSGADGCPIEATEQVHLYVAGTLALSQDVDTSNGPDFFDLGVGLSEGTHEVRVDWERKGKVLASRTLTLTHNTDDDGDGVLNDADVCPGWDDTADHDRDGIPDGCDTDSDGDGFADRVDNCRDVVNSDQSDLDGDGKGDACDSDMDGDGHSNGKETSHGTDPADPNSYPGKAKVKL